jgi:signal transduction histidine kinase
MGEQPFLELKETALKTIRARRITLGVFAAVALVVILTSGISYLNPLFYAPLIWFLITFPFQYLINRQRNERSLHWVHTGFFMVEIVIITLFVHLTGGSQWIGNIFYLFTVIYANFFLPPLQGYLITALVILLYTLVIMLEYAGAIPHQFLFPLHEAPYRSLSYNLTTILAGVAAIYAILAYTVRSFTNIYARKNRALAEREKELAELSKRLLAAHEEERRRIARELHDNLNQSLAAVKLHLAALKDEIPNEEKQEIFTIIDQAIAETRTLAYSLRPPLLDDLGLVPSLRRLTEMVESASGLKIHLHLEEGSRLPQPVANLLFYVTQEAIRNARQHSRAKRIDVTLTRTPGSVTLSVKDDGIGFRPQESQGLGLRGMRERVEVSGGEMTVVSQPGCGTSITVEVPCESDTNRDRG